MRPSIGLKKLYPRHDAGLVEACSGAAALARSYSNNECTLISSLGNQSCFIFTLPYAATREKIGMYQPYSFKPFELAFLCFLQVLIPGLFRSARRSSNQTNDIPTLYVLTIGFDLGMLESKSPRNYQVL